jgi:hypothetical protein
MCCGNGTSFQSAKDGHGGTLRNVQNPIYGDTSHDRDGSASSRPTQDHLYAAIVKTLSQELLTSADSLPGEALGGTELGHDYAANGVAPPECAQIIVERTNPGERTEEEISGIK